MAISQLTDRADVCNNSYVSSVVTVGTSQVEAKVGASPLTDRQVLIIKNGDVRSIYVGPTGVTTSGSTKGIELERLGSLVFEVGPQISVFMIAGSAGTDVVVQELA